MARASSRPRWRGCRCSRATAICAFEWKGPIADAIAHLGRCRVAIDAGPMQRFGAKGAGTSVYFRDPDGSLLEFISYQPEAEIAHDRARTIPTCCPPTLPVPQDDGAARHLDRREASHRCRSRRPTARRSICRSSAGRTVVYIYPRTGVPGKQPPDGWDAIPGARGCTPQSCSFRDHFAELKRLGVAATLRPLDAGHRLPARGGGAAASAVSGAVGREARARTRAQAADLHGRRHDADQAHGADHRRRRHHQGVLSGVSARQERRRRCCAWLAGDPR